MKFFYITLPKHYHLHNELCSLFGVLYLLQYKQHAIPAFQLEQAQKIINKYFPAQSQRLLTSPRYKDARDFHSWLKGNISKSSEIAPRTNFACFGTLTPLPYQESGLESILERISHGMRGAILGDEPGLGKTCQAISVYNYFHSKHVTKKDEKTLDTVLIVCPNSVKGNWGREWNKCAMPDYPVATIYADSLPSLIRTHKISIINNDLLHKFRKELIKKKFDYIIIDEAHNYAKGDSKRGRVLKQICANSKFTLALSGTPIKNYVRDLRNILSLIDPEFIWNNKKLYEKTFCDLKRGEYGNISTGASNIRMLTRILKMCYLIRRKKSDIEIQLPKKTRMFLPIELKEGYCKNSIYRFQLENFNSVRKFSEFKKLKSIPAKFRDDKTIQRARIDIGLYKVPAVCSLVDEQIEKGESVVLFCYHKEVFEKYKEIYGNKALYISGGTSGKVRTKTVSDFEAGKKSLIVLSLDACSEGLTLIKSSYMVQSEFDWKAVVHAQAEDRIHRVGQTRECEIVYPYIPNTLDEYIMGVLGYKNTTAKRVLR